MFIFSNNFTLYLAKLFKVQNQIFLKYKLFSLIHYFFPIDSDLFHRKSNFPYSFHSLQCLIFLSFFFLSFSFAFCENFSVGSSHHRCWFFLLLPCTDFNSEILSRVSNKILSVYAAPVLFLLLIQKLKIQALKSDWPCLSIWASDCMCNFGQVKSIW